MSREIDKRYRRTTQDLTHSESALDPKSNENHCNQKGFHFLGLDNTRPSHPPPAKYDVGPPNGGFGC